MDLQTTDRLYSNTASSLFDRRDAMARDDAGRSEAFRNFLKDAETRRADERQGERRADRQSAGRGDDTAPADRRDERAARRAESRADTRADNRADNRSEAKTGTTEFVNDTQPAEQAATGKAAAPAQERPQAPVETAGNPAESVKDGAADTRLATDTGDAASAPQQDAGTPDATNAADQPDLPETVPAPVAVSDAPAEAVTETTVPAVAAQPVAADTAGQKKTKAAGADAQAGAASGKTAQSNAAAKAAQAAANAGNPAIVDAAASGDGAAQTSEKTVQNAAVPTTVEGEAKAQPAEGQLVDARPAGTPPVPSQPSEQGVPALAQNGAATAASANAGASASALTGGQMGGTQEPGLESLAADAGRGARGAGEPAAPAASGQGAASAGAASSGGAQANAGGDGNGQSAGQNAGQNTAAKQPQQAAVGADQSGTAKPAANDSFTNLLARAQGDARGADPMAAGTARPGEGSVVTLGASSAPGVQAAASAAAAQSSAPSVPRPPMPVSNQVAIQLHNAAKDDVRKVTIHLRPEAMGKVEVSMEVDQAGRLQAVISADKAEALDWLRRDAHHLERALQDAGMKMDQQSLSFNLRGDGQSGGEGGGKGSGGRGGVLGQGDEMVEAPADGIVRRLDALIDVSV